MQRRGKLFPVFFLFFLLSVVILILSASGIGKGIAGFFEHMTIPLQRLTFSSLHESTDKAHQTPEAKLREENNNLLSQLAKQKELERENQALHDQFQTSNPSPKSLLPAKVIGMTAFVPGISPIDELVIDKGMSDGVQINNVIVVNNNLVGKIVKTSTYFSMVALLLNNNTTFTVQTMKSSTLGVIRGGGGDTLLLDNVVLSDKLEKDDIVITKGDLDGKGNGYPPDLVVGKINSVNKKTSALFQTGEVRSLLDFSKLETVFVIISKT